MPPLLAVSIVGLNSQLRKAALRHWQSARHVMGSPAVWCLFLYPLYLHLLAAPTARCWLLGACLHLQPGQEPCSWGWLCQAGGICLNLGCRGFARRAPGDSTHTQNPGVIMQPLSCVLNEGDSSVPAERSWESRSDSGRGTALCLHHDPAHMCGHLNTHLSASNQCPAFSGCQ